MQIISLPFLGSLLLFMLVYLRAGAASQNLLLLLGSLLFICTWEPIFLLYYLVFSLSNYWLALHIQSATNSRSRLLILAILGNLAFLAFLKYSDFFLGELASPALKILFPIGLSYMVLEAIAYQVDCARGQAEPDRNFAELALYWLYFPKLLSGPIMRAKDFAEQIVQRRQLDAASLNEALWLILFGAFHKRLIADALFRLLPADLFQEPAGFAGGELAFGLLIFGVAIYNDFAGYTNFVRGVSLLLGIRLPRNFATPYLARSFSDFWERWHISLSNWLRDYIFFPVNRFLRLRLPKARALVFFLPPLTTMLVSGLWHGAVWNFLVWGGLHGSFLALERIPQWRGRAAAGTETQPALRRVFAHAKVVVLALLVWIPFAMPLDKAADFFAGLFGRYSAVSLDPRALILIALSISLDALQAKREDFYLSWSSWKQAALLAALLLLIGFSALAGGPETFLYQGF